MREPQRNAAHDEAKAMKHASAIRRDGSINPECYDIVDGCHLWNLGLIGGRPVSLRNGQRTSIRLWVTHSEPRRQIRATCRNDRCINTDHLVVALSVSETTAALMARLPNSALRDDDRVLLQQRADGASVRAIAEGLGLPVGRVAHQLRTADIRMHRILAELDRQSANTDLARLPHQEDQHPRER